MKKIIFVTLLFSFMTIAAFPFTLIELITPVCESPFLLTGGGGAYLWTPDYYDGYFHFEDGAWLMLNVENTLQNPVISGFLQCGATPVNEDYFTSCTIWGPLSDCTHQICSSPGSFYQHSSWGPADSYQLDATNPMIPGVYIVHITFNRRYLRFLYVNNFAMAFSYDPTVVGQSDLNSSIPCDECVSSFAPETNKQYVISGWVREDNAPGTETVFSAPSIQVSCGNTYTFNTSGEIIDGWERIEGYFTTTSSINQINIVLNCSGGSNNCLFDDIRVFPFDGSMKSYVYDPTTLRLMAELDERNYATRYEYDEEGKLLRVKKETERGIMTIQESKNSAPKVNN